jgi:hypothetical protein
LLLIGKCCCCYRHNKKVSIAIMSRPVVKWVTDYETRMSKPLDNTESVDLVDHMYFRINDGLVEPCIAPIESEVWHADSVYKTDFSLYEDLVNDILGGVPSLKTMTSIVVSEGHWLFPDNKLTESSYVNDIEQKVLQSLPEDSVVLDPAPGFIVKSRKVGKSFQIKFTEKFDNIEDVKNIAREVGYSSSNIANKGESLEELKRKTKGRVIFSGYNTGYLDFFDRNICLGIDLDTAVMYRDFVLNVDEGSETFEYTYKTRLRMSKVIDKGKYYCRRAVYSHMPAYSPTPLLASLMVVTNFDHLIGLGIVPKPVERHDTALFYALVGDKYKISNAYYDYPKYPGQGKIEFGKFVEKERSPVIRIRNGYGAAFSYDKVLLVQDYWYEGIKYRIPVDAEFPYVHETRQVLLQRKMDQILPFEYRSKWVRLSGDPVKDGDVVSPSLSSCHIPIGNTEFKKLYVVKGSHSEVSLGKYEAEAIIRGYKLEPGGKVTAERGRTEKGEVSVVQDIGKTYFKVFNLGILTRGDQLEFNGYVWQPVSGDHRKDINTVTPLHPYVLTHTRNLVCCSVVEKYERFKLVNTSCDFVMGEVKTGMMVD